MKSMELRILGSSTVLSMSGASGGSDGGCSPASSAGAHTSWMEDDCEDIEIDDYRPKSSGLGKSGQGKR